MPNDALRTYFDFIMSYAPYFYYLPDSGTVDPEWGRGPTPAAFAIEFLYEAYDAKEFETEKTSIYNKIVVLADYLLLIQCNDNLKLAYGGFKSKDDSTYYYSIDAMRAIPALLKAYDLTGAVAYYDAAKLAGGTFLYNMQHKPSELGIHDKYYGGFAQAVTIADLWVPDMWIIDLYSLKALKSLYTRTGEAKYQTMTSDALGFHRSGFENIYLKYSPPPNGDGAWHRTGLPENLIYDDDFAYALNALYGYEGWSKSVKEVYDFISAIGACSEYPAYNSAVCWAGYVDVVNRRPACEYYDSVTSGILYEIRNTLDALAIEQSVKTILQSSDAFMFWGVKFPDYSPVERKKSIVTVSWLAHLLLNYNPVASAFARILQTYGELVTIHTRREVDGTVSYSSNATVLAVVNPAQANEILIEPGYASNDYVRIYLLSAIAHRDRMTWRNTEYEIGPVEEVRFRDQLMYHTALCRRLIK